MRISAKCIPPTLPVLLLYSVLLTASEVCYRHFFAAPLLAKGILEEWAFIAAFLAIFLYAKFKITKVVVAVLFFVACVVNNVHFEIYRSWGNAVNYFLAFVEYREVAAAGSTYAKELLIPILWGMTDFLLFLSIGYLGRRHPAHTCVMDIILAAAMLSIVYRSINTSHEYGVSPRDSYGRVKSTYFVTGYLVGHMIPYNLFDLSLMPEYRQPAPKDKVTPKTTNIIFLVGESGAAYHWSTFGYARPTTPNAERLLKGTDADHLILRDAYSAGMLTAVSLPLLFNAIPHPNGLNQIASGDTNILRLAQEQGFHTCWFTAQPESEMGIINTIGRKYLNELTYPTTFGMPFRSPARDDILLDQLKQVRFDGVNRKFIALHQRGSHVPYGALLKPEEKIFGDANNLDRYDATIYHTDALIGQVIQYLKTLPTQDWIFIYTSDHGQFVRANVANQATINNPDSYVVPLLIYSPQQQLIEEAKKMLASPSKTFHHQLATYIIELLGYRDMPVDNGSVGYVTGNMITGDAGFLKFEGADKVELIKP